MVNTIILFVSIVIFILYIRDMKNTKFKTKEIVLIAMFSAISYILYMIHFIRYPQGGGITLFSMLPTMLLSLLYGRCAGVTSGLIFGLFKLLNGGYIMHPIQFILDYLLSTMSLGLAGEFGRSKNIDIIKGCLLASSLSVLMSVISGAVFFGQFAPEGMNVWVYSFIYNASSAGVEGLLTTILMLFIPIKRFEKVLKLSTN